MQVLVRPELPTAALRSSQATLAAVDNSAPLATRPQSTYKSGKVVQTSGATSGNWIVANCVGADHLHPETVDVVSNFTLMWNLFEGIACQNHANIKRFESLAEKIAQHDPHLEGVDDAISFWTFRYWTGSNFRDRFNDLRFRPNDRRDHVEAVLRKEKTDSASQLLAVMIIVYRLRNNLFHGLKTVDMLNDQAANLDMACRALAAVLEASGNYPVHRQVEPNERFNQRFERGRSQAGPST